MGGRGAPPPGQGGPGRMGRLTIVRLESRIRGWSAGAKRMLSRAVTETDMPEGLMMQRGASVTWSFSVRGASTTSGLWGRGQRARLAKQPGYRLKANWTLLDYPGTLGGQRLAKKEPETTLWCGWGKFTVLQLACIKELKTKLPVLITALEARKGHHNRGLLLQKNGKVGSMMKTELGLWRNWTAQYFTWSCLTRLGAEIGTCLALCSSGENSVVRVNYSQENRALPAGLFLPPSPTPLTISTMLPKKEALSKTCKSFGTWNKNGAWGQAVGRAAGRLPAVPSSLCCPSRQPSLPWSPERPPPGLPRHPQTPCLAPPPGSRRRGPNRRSAQRGPCRPCVPSR